MTGSTGGTTEATLGCPHPLTGDVALPRPMPLLLMTGGAALLPPGTAVAYVLTILITGTIYVCRRDALVLFDLGSTYSYVFSLFAPYLYVSRESMGVPVYVSTPVGDSINVDRVYRSCVVTFCGYETRTDLPLLDMVDFKVILGMDWLSLYHSILDCHAKTITLVMHEFPRLEWRGSSVRTSSRVISFLKA
ncbi:uncharacterized protein [Nicotiana tomentosiformis]|uniref:uncharacterized protein n=1 Tax=Nicotiana tomentosiformis TaxID=4098 RepID=UPI00388C7FCC